MTVALNDTALLADMLRPLPDLADPLATAAATAAFHTRRKPLSATINTLANALYRVFCAGPGAAHEAMRQARRLVALLPQTLTRVFCLGPCVAHEAMREARCIDVHLRLAPLVG